MSGLRDQLEAVRGQYGKLTPSIVVDAARPADAPLHERFEWDDTIAAERWRTEQAADLIRSVRVVYAKDENGPRSVRSYLAIHADDEAPGREYVPVEDVVSDPLMHRMVLRELERDIAALKSKYGHLKEFADLIVKAAA